jgi:hypothetical protein
MARSAVTSLFQSKAAGALLVMAHPFRWCEMHVIVPFLSVLAVGFGCYLTFCAAVPKFRVRAISRDPVSVLLAVSVFSIGLGLAGFGVAPRYTKLTAFVAFGTSCIAAILHKPK